MNWIKITQDNTPDKEVCLIDNKTKEYLLGYVSYNKERDTFVGENEHEVLDNVTHFCHLTIPTTEKNPFDAKTANEYPIVVLEGRHYIIAAYLYRVQSTFKGKDYYNASCKFVVLEDHRGDGDVVAVDTLLKKYESSHFRVLQRVSKPFVSTKAMVFYLAKYGPLDAGYKIIHLPKFVNLRIYSGEKEVFVISTYDEHAISSRETHYNWLRSHYLTHKGRTLDSSIGSFTEKLLSNIKDLDALHIKSNPSNEIKAIVNYKTTVKEDGKLITLIVLRPVLREKKKV